MNRIKKGVAWMLVMALLVALCSGTGVVSADEAEYTLGAEMLKNGDFEQGISCWAAEGTPGNTWIKNGKGRDDSVGMAITEAEANENGEVVQFYQGSLDLVPGNRYILSFDYLAAPNNTFYVRSGSIGCGKNTITLKEDADGTWKTYTKVFTVPATYTPIPDMGIGVYSTKIGDVPAVVDNLSIREYILTAKAESIQLDREELTMAAGASQTLRAVTTPIMADMNGTVWTSSDETVVTVQYGVVRAVGGGKATITATSPNGVKDTCDVTVSGASAILKNGNFENNDLSAWEMTGAAAEQGKGYAKSVGLAVASKGTASQTLSGLMPNTTYTVSGCACAPEGETVRIAVKQGDTVLAEHTKAYNAQWKPFEVTFTTPASLSGDIVLVLAGAESGTWYADDLIAAKDTTGEDLTVESVDWDGGDGQVTPRTKLTFTVTVKNVGTTDVTEPFDVDISAGTDRIFRITYEDGVKAGEAVEITTEKWKAVKGDYMITAAVNTTATVIETEMRNNSYQTNLRVANDRVTPTYTNEEIDAFGFTDLVFSDDFDSLQWFDTLGSGREGYKWYVSRPYEKSYLDIDDYEVKDGILTLKNKKSTYNYGMATVDAFTGNGFTFNKGYLEFRLRIPSFDENKKGVPAVWSFPKDKTIELDYDDYAKQWVEMDWMEYWGVKKNYPAGHWTVSMHETVRGENEEGKVDPNIKIANHSAGNRHKDGLGDAQWHIISFYWVDDLLVGYLDGDECFRMAYGEDVIPSPVVINNAKEDGTGAFAYMNQQELGLILGGSIGNHMELDYIRVWQVSDGELSASTGGATDGVVWITVGAGVLLGIAAVAVIVLIKRRKKQA